MSESTPAKGLRRPVRTAVAGVTVREDGTEFLERASSNVVSATYDPAARSLRVDFKSGAYHYAKVSRETWDALCIAESIGSFVARTIRPNHECVREGA